MPVYQMRTGALTGTLSWIESAIGGGIASGVATIAVIPLAVGGGVFVLLYFLGADSLILTEVQIE